jgi:hypothetical protein
MSTNLAGRWALVTGASSGFGAATALRFAAEKANLLLGARRVSRLEEIAAEAIRRGAPAARVHALDVMKTSSVEVFAAWARSITPKIDVLVNNAGGAIGRDPVAGGKDEDWEFMLQANVLGVLRMTRALLPLIPSGGSIVNVGSVAGRTAYEGGAAYCAAKAGELQITRSLRLELCGSGIRVGTIDPGLAETEFSVVRFRGDRDQARKVYEGIDALTSEDVAEAIVWMASRPAHVNIDEILIQPTDQASVFKIHRRPAKER